MAAKVLVYHMEAGRRQLLEGLCRALGIVPVFVEQESWRAPIGLLSGNAKQSLFAVSAPDAGRPEGKREALPGIREEMIVMCGFTRLQFDTFLDSLRMAGLVIGLKAVETETNQGWSGEALQQELCRERDAFSRARKERARREAVPEKKHAPEKGAVPGRMNDPGKTQAMGVSRTDFGQAADRAGKDGQVRASGRLSMEELRTLAQQAVKVIPERVAYYASRVGVTYGRITIRNQKSRWGSCSSKGNLNFNCLLMLAPMEVIDSVVVHELCHRLEMNHSKRFYEHVLRVYPEYYRYHAWLKEHGSDIMRRMTG